MKKNWLELEKGDPLYVMVPIEDEDGDIIYEYQESAVISNKPCFNYDGVVKFVNIRFKYTDKNGKRIREQICVHPYDSEIGNNSYYDIKYGEIYVTYINKEFIQIWIKNLINEEIEKTKENIEHQNKYINKLENSIC